MFTMQELIDKLPDSQQMNYSVLQETGAIIHLAFVWNCDIDQD